MLDESRQLAHAFSELFEERILDGVCAGLRMEWDDFIGRVRKGWNPPGVYEHYLAIYRQARSILPPDCWDRETP